MDEERYCPHQGFGAGIFAERKIASINSFRFWLNDDHDAVVDGVAQNIQLTASNADDLHNQIANTRDLEDFTRVQIKAPANFPRHSRPCSHFAGVAGI